MGDSRVEGAGISIPLIQHTINQVSCARCEATLTCSLSQLKMKVRISAYHATVMRLVLGDELTKSTDSTSDCSDDGMWKSEINTIDDMCARKCRGMLRG